MGGKGGGRGRYFSHGFCSPLAWPWPGGEQDAVPSTGRERCGATSPHPGPTGTTQSLFSGRMLQLPASQPHTSRNCCRLPRPPLLPGPTPCGHTSLGRGWQVQHRAPCPHGKPCRGRCRERDSDNPENPEIPVPERGLGRGGRLAACPCLSFPSPEPAGALGTDKTLSCGPSKASGSHFSAVDQRRGVTG